MKRIICGNVLLDFIQTGIVSALMAAAMITSNASAASSEMASNNFKWKDGAEIYAKVCGYCHEPHSGAQVGPKIRGRELPVAYIRTVVRYGNRAMPSFRLSEIDDDSLTKLAEYISGK
jgi:mono/diheme cytochrome c family protein